MKDTKVSAHAADTAEDQCADRCRLGDDGAVSDGAAGAGSTDLCAAMLYLCMEVAGCPTVCRRRR